MDKSKFDTNSETRLDPAYQNGQSDAEKLMHRHLQSNDDITDEELNAIAITKTDTTTASAPTAAPDREDDSANEDNAGSDRIVTPLDVLGG